MLETLTLSDSDARRLADAVAPQAAQPWQQSGIDGYANLAACSADSFRQIQSWLRQQLQHRPALAALLVRDLPVDPPAHGFAKPTSASEAVLVSISSMLGEVLTYADHRGGQLVHDLYPRPEDAAKQLGTGNVYLEGHTEDAHLRYNCDFVALLCLRGDPQALTLVSRVQPEALAPTDLAELTRPQFVIAADDSYDAPTASAYPVIEQRGSDWKVRFDPLYTTPRSERAAEALQNLRKHVETTYRSIQLTPGDMLVLNNNVAVHARTAFAPRFDGTDRWVQRASIYAGPIPRELRSPDNPRLLREYPHER